MDKLLFGISGLPLGNNNNKFTYSTGIEYLSSIGLDAMELPFVRSVNITEKNYINILEVKEKYDFYLSAHGSYYINLNAEEEQKQVDSMDRIIKGVKGIEMVNGRSLVFHPGFYLKNTPEDTFKNISENLKNLPKNTVDYRLETTGKPTQFGNLEELVSLCKEIDNCKLCVDFSHIHARNNGSLKNYDNFINILSYIESELGKNAILDMHIHLSGINYGLKGEKNHLPFLESDFNFLDCMKALKDFGVKGCIICESPLLERDALLLKETYERL